MEFLWSILAKIELFCQQTQVSGANPSSWVPERMTGGWWGGLAMFCQIVKLHPLQEIFRVDLDLGGCLHGVWSSWRTNCKIFLKKWWEISRRWGQAGALWICPMWHSILWWKGIHNQHLRINSPWGNRRVAPTPASPYPLWPLSLVCHLLGHH